MDAERQRRAVRRNVVEQRVQILGAPAHDVEHRAEDFFLQVAGAIERR